MDTEEKRFKILKRQEYEDQLSDVEKELNKIVFYVGIASIGAIIGMIVSVSNNDLPLISRLAFTALSCTNTYYATSGLKQLINAMSKKINIKIRLEDIDDELEKIRENSSDDILQKGTGLKK